MSTSISSPLKTSPSQTALLQTSKVTVIPYHPALKSHFKRLNEAWISKLFKMEAEDLLALDNAEETILAPGGQIFFAILLKEGETAALLSDESFIAALDESRVVGTGALKAHTEDEYELAKMGVDESLRGLGIGKHLMQAAVDYAKTQGKKSLYLETNSSLHNAIKLYERFGFKHVPVPSDSKFARADVAMRLILR